jgi:hypothetical protein
MPQSIVQNDKNQHSIKHEYKPAFLKIADILKEDTLEKAQEQTTEQALEQNTNKKA